MILQIFIGDECIGGFDDFSIYFGKFVKVKDGMIY